MAFFDRCNNKGNVIKYNNMGIERTVLIIQILPQVLGSVTKIFFQKMQKTDIHFFFVFLGKFL